MANEQTIANLIIKLSADVSSVGPGLKKVEAEIKSFTGGLAATIGPAVTKIAAGLTAVLGSAGFVSAISGARTFAAEMSRMSEKIGIPVETLSGLADAADDSGVSLESVGTSLKFLSRNLFEASRGTGDLKSIMQEMGIAFESAPGVIRPTVDVLFDVAEKFAQMEKGAGKTALALKYFGRSGENIIPLLNMGKALREAEDNARKFGLVIDEELGKKARLLGLTLNEIGDAVRGLAFGIMKALMPSMQGAADSTLSLATYINSLRLRLNEIGEVLRYVGAVALPLLVVQIGSMVSAVGLANIAMKAFGATIAFFSGPVGWISAALAGLSVLWVKLGAGARAAAQDHTAYVAAVSSLKPEDLQKSLVAMTDYLAMVQQKIGEARKAIGEAAPSFAQGMALDTLLKYEAEAKARIAAVQKLQEAVNKPAKTPAPFIPDSKILKELQDRTAALGAEFAAFQDPVKGASAAIEEFIRKTVGDTPKLGAIAKAANDVRAAFKILFDAQQKRANVAAAEKGTFAASVAEWEAYGADLHRQFDNGLIDIRSFFQERRSLIEAQTAAEILLLQAEKGRKETTPARRIEIDAEIVVQGIKQGATIKKELADETAAWRTLGETSLDFEQRMAEAQGRVLDGKRKALEIDMQAYEISLRGRGVSSEDAKKQADDLFAAKTKEIDFNEQLRQFGIEMADLDIRKQKIQDDLAVGIGNQATAEEATLALERQRIPVLQAMADNAERLAAASKDPALLQQVENLNATIRQLGISTDESGRRFADFKAKSQDALINGFANFLSRGIAEAKTFGEAVKNMAQNFAQAMTDIVAQMLATMAVKAMFNAIMGIASPSTAATSGAAGSVGSGIVMAAEGGPIRGPGTGTSDSIPAYLSDGEFVHPAAAVRYYGANVMEAIRRRIIPRDILKGFGFFPVARPQFAFAGGGMAASSAGAAMAGGGQVQTVNIGFNIQTNDAAGFDQLLLQRQHMIEGMVANGLRQGGAIRDATRRFR